MKYIVFVECKPENLKKWIKKTIQQTEERSKFPDKYPKLVMGNQFLGSITKAFVVYEVEKEEQIINLNRYLKMVSSPTSLWWLMLPRTSGVSF